VIVEYRYLVHRWFEGGVTFAPPPPTTFRTVSLSNPPRRKRVRL
jgi:hypothetical protein